MFQFTYVPRLSKPGFQRVAGAGTFIKLAVGDLQRRTMVKEGIWEAGKAGRKLKT